MGCTVTLSGIPFNCETNTGGIKKVYVTNYEDVSTVSVDPSTNMIKTITMQTSAKFKEYSLRKQTSSMTSTLTKDDAVGTMYYTTDLNLQFSKSETAKRLEISAMSLGQMAAIAEDMNGKFWYLGYDNYVTGINTVGQTGQAYGDLNGYTITLQDMSVDLPYEVDPSALGTII